MFILIYAKYINIFKNYKYINETHVDDKINKARPIMKNCISLARYQVQFMHYEKINLCKNQEMCKTINIKLNLLMSNLFIHTIFLWLNKLFIYKRFLHQYFAQVSCGLSFM